MSKYTALEEFEAFAFVMGMGYLGGIAFGLLDGYTFPKIWRFPGFTIKRFSDKFRMPPLVVMIILGFLVRSYAGDLVKAYPDKPAALVRNCVLAIALARAGLSITFKGKGLFILLLVFVPQTIEALILVGVAYGLFETPIGPSFALAYSMSTVASALLVIIMISYM